MMNKAQVCFNPGSFIPLKDENLAEIDLTNVTAYLWMVKELGFDGLHLWTDPNRVFNRTFTSDECHPVVIEAYNKILKLMYEKGLEVTAKIPFYAMPWWWDQQQGIRNPTDPKFLEDIRLYSQMIVKMMEVFPTIKTWTIGNEPQIEGSLYGHPPGLNQPHHTLENLAIISSQILYLVNEQKPFWVELVGPAIVGLGVSGVGLAEPNEWLDILWPKISDSVSKISINAYPPEIDGKVLYGFDYYQAYSKLLREFPDITFVPSEQAIRADKTPSELWRLRELVGVSMKTFGFFSYFHLYSKIGINFALVNPDGEHTGRQAALEKMLVKGSGE